MTSTFNQRTITYKKFICTLNPELNLSAHSYLQCYIVFINCYIWHYTDISLSSQQGIASFNVTSRNPKGQRLRNINFCLFSGSRASGINCCCVTVYKSIFYSDLEKSILQKKSSDPDAWLHLVRHPSILSLLQHHCSILFQSKGQGLWPE